MCGITGYYSFEKEGAGAEKLNAIDNALHSIKHRGPDGQGVFKNHKTALAHARLSILDISDAASQPFYSKDKRYVLVFNGEIFNFNDLPSCVREMVIVFHHHCILIPNSILIIIIEFHQTIIFFRI